MSNKSEQHPVDILGQPLSLGNYVAATRQNSMYICRIIKVNPKMIRVVKIKPTGGWEKDGWLVYPSQTVKIVNEDATVYILKNA